MYDNDIFNIWYDQWKMRIMSKGSINQFNSELNIFIIKWEIINLKSRTTHIQFSKNINIVELWRLISSILQLVTQ